MASLISSMVYLCCSWWSRTATVVEELEKVVHEMKEKHSKRDGIFFERINALETKIVLYKKGDTDQLHQIQQNVFNEKHLSPDGIIQKFLGL